MRADHTLAGVPRVRWRREVDVLWFVLALSACSPTPYHMTKGLPPTVTPTGDSGTETPNCAAQALPGYTATATACADTATHDAPNLVLAKADVCQGDCANGRLVVQVFPGNLGNAPASAGATVTLYSIVAGKQSQLAAIPVNEAIPDGAYLDAIVFDLNGHDPSTWTSLVARITPAAADTECDTTDDELPIAGPFCGG
jgi:hypothetical protein